MTVNYEDEKTKLLGWHGMAAVSKRPTAGHKYGVRQLYLFISIQPSSNDHR